MTFMVIEHFYTNKLKELYDRFDKKGRLLPDGVSYVNSWIDENVRTCYQIMESPSIELLMEWIKQWEDLAEFEIIPVISSAQAKKIVLSK